MSDEKESKHGVQSLEVGAGVLRAVVNGHRAMMLKEIAAAADIPPSKAHRYLVSLIRSGLIEQDPATSRYSLGPFALNIGLDVYSLWESMQSIMQYLKKTDPAALEMAEAAFRCFEPYQVDEGRSYARASQFVPELCENEVLHLLKEIQQKMPTYNTDHENVFSAEQNALIAVHAEKYYRALVTVGPSTRELRGSMR